MKIQYYNIYYNIAFAQIFPGYKPVFCVGDPSPHAENWAKISDEPKMDITRFATQAKGADAAAATTTTTKKTKIMYGFQSVCAVSCVCFIFHAHILDRPHDVLV